MKKVLVLSIALLAVITFIVAMKLRESDKATNPKIGFAKLNKKTASQKRLVLKNFNERREDDSELKKVIERAKQDAEEAKKISEADYKAARLEYFKTLIREKYDPALYKYEKIFPDQPEEKLAPLDQDKYKEAFDKMVKDLGNKVKGYNFQCRGLLCKVEITANNKDEAMQVFIESEKLYKLPYFLIRTIYYIKYEPQNKALFFVDFTTKSPSSQNPNYVPYKK